MVKELHLLTPHSWLYIEVKGDAPRANRNCGRSKPPLARSWKRWASRATHSSPARSSRRAVTRCGQDQRVLARVPEDQGRHGQGLGRRQRSPARRFLAEITPCALSHSCSDACFRCPVWRAREWQEYEPAGRVPNQLPRSARDHDEFVDVATELHASSTCTAPSEVANAIR